MADERISSYIDLESIKGETDEFLKQLGLLKGELAGIKKAKINVDTATTTKELGSAVAEVSKTLGTYNEALKKVEQAEVKVGEAARKSSAGVRGKKAANDEAAASTTKVTDAQEQLANQWLADARNVKVAKDGYNDLVNQLIDNREATEQLTARQKGLKLAYQDGALTEQEYRDNLVEIEGAKKRLSVSTNDLNRALRNATKEQEANAGSANQLRAKLNQLLQTYDALSDADVAGNVGAELKTQITDITASITKFEQGTGRFQRNVGNYSQAVQTLEGGLKDVRSQLAALNAAGNGSAEVIEKLTMQEALLSNLVEGQAAGFASATAEVKNNEKALQALANAGLRNTEFYQKLLQETADLKDNVGDLKAEIKNLGSDTQVLDGLIGSAQLLAGTYAIATEGAQLFGLSQEDADEATKKSAAIIAVLTGLQSIQNALQKESATLLFLNSVGSKAAAAATTLYAFATAGATVATKALRLALVSTGIGAIVVLVGYLVSKLAALSEGANEAAEKIKAFGEATKALNDIISKQNDASSKVLEDITRAGREQLAIAEANGASAQELLNLRKQIAIQDKANAQQSLKNLELTENGVISLEAKRQIIYEQQIEAAKRLRFLTLSGDEGAIKSATKIVEELDLQASVIDSKLVPARAAVNTLVAANLALETEAGAQAMENISERQKAFQIERIAYETRSAAAAAIAEDETKSFAARIAGAKKYQALQIAIAQSERDEKLLDPSLSAKDKVLAERTAQAAITAVRVDGAKQVKDLLIEQEERLSAARLGIANTYREKSIRINEAIVDDEKKKYAERLDAAYENYLLQSQIVADNLKNELKNRTLTNEERKRLTIASAEEQQALTMSYGIKQLELVGANQEQITAIIEREEARRLQVIDNAARARNLAINKNFLGGGSSVAKREAEEARAASEATEKRLLEESKQAQARLMATKVNTKERFDAEADLLAKVDELSQFYADKEAARQAKLTDLRKQLAGEAFETLKAFIDAGFENRKNELADEDATNEKRNARELELNEASAASEEEKANRVILINARAAAEKESIARRQKQIDVEKARFEKAASIASIVVNTALAISKQLTATPLPAGAPFVALIAAIGALQLAKAIATPIPRYKHGTGPGGHKGGDFVAGDGGKHEPIILPSGQMFISPNTPTLYPDMPAGTQVLSSIDELDSNMAALALKQLTARSRTAEGSAIEALLMAQERQSTRIERAIERKRMVTIYSTHAGVVASSTGAANSIQWQLSKTHSK